MDNMIYLDNNATTQPLPEVVDAMTICLRESYANPSSVHRFGQMVRHEVECARVKVAELIGASAKEIVFTGGGTESINLAIRGVLAMHPQRRRFITTTTEHSAGISLAQQLQSEGYSVDFISVDRDGLINKQQYQEMLSDDTALVSLIHVNNETGVINDVEHLAGIASDRGIPVHVDAVQSVGKIKIIVQDWPVQLLSMAGHKFHGPKGIGALYVRRKTHIAPLILGGNQERNLRAGTEPVAEIVGMGIACEIATRDSEQTENHIRILRDALESGITKAIPFTRVIGKNAPRIYNTTNIAFESLEAEAILILLSEAGICASAGSACSSGSLEPSHVLQAMGIEDRLAHGAIRFSLSRFNTQEEIDRVIQIVPGLLNRLTALSHRS